MQPVGPGPAQRGGGLRVGARGAPDAEVDPAGVQCLEGAELLRDDERAVISTGGDELAIPGMPWCSATQ